MDSKKEKIINLMFNDATSDGEKLSCIERLKKLGGIGNLGQNVSNDSVQSLILTIHNLRSNLEAEYRKNDNLRSSLDIEISRGEVNVQRAKVLHITLVCTIAVVVIMSMIGANTMQDRYEKTVSEYKMKVRNLEYKLEEEKKINKILRQGK